MWTKTIVIGDNVAEQMQPFHEFESTGIDDKYIVETKHTRKEKDKLDFIIELLYENEGIPYISNINEYLQEPTMWQENDLYKQAKYWYWYFDENKEPILVDRTNPNSKWDWWRIWDCRPDNEIGFCKPDSISGAILLKNGERSSVAMIKDIDVDNLKCGSFVYKGEWHTHDEEDFTEEEKSQNLKNNSWFAPKSFHNKIQNIIKSMSQETKITLLYVHY